jgi:hypothetical protein
LAVRDLGVKSILHGSSRVPKESQTVQTFAACAVASQHPEPAEPVNVPIRRFYDNRRVTQQVRGGRVCGMTTELEVELATEKDLEVELKRCIAEGNKLGYRTGRFPQVIKKRGPVEACKRIIRRAETVPTGGVEFARKHDCLELTVEGVVSNPRFTDLFNDEDREISRKTLETERAKG